MFQYAFVILLCVFLRCFEVLTYAARCCGNLTCAAAVLIKQLQHILIFWFAIGFKLSLQITHNRTCLWCSHACCRALQLFRQLCADAGCPLEDGVYKRPRASPAGAKEEVPDWIPDLNPRSRKPKRKSDAVYSFDSSEGGRHGASYGHAAAAAAAFSAGMSDYDGDDLAAADTAHRGSGRNGLELGDVTSGSSGEDLTHKHTHLSALQVHLQQLQQQQQQQGHQRINDHGGFDPTAAAAAAVASAARDGVLISPQRSALHLQDPGFILGPQAAAAAAAAAAAEDDDDDADPAAAATAVDGEDLDADGMMEDRHPAVAAAAAMGREHRPSDDAVRSLMHLRASSPGDDDMPGSAAAAAAAAVAGRGSGELDHPTLAEFKQQQQQQQQQPRHFSPALAVSTGRGGRTGRPRGRPPTRGRGRGRGRVKRESEPLQVGSPLHPVGALYQHPNAAGVYHGSGGLGAATAQHYGGSFGGLGERVQGQSTLARLTHAAAMAEGMGTRGDRSRPDDYYQVYTEYFAAQEAYHRLVSVCRSQKENLRGLFRQGNVPCLRWLLCVTVYNERRLKQRSVGDS
jgi:hypothetical protein